MNIFKRYTKRKRKSKDIKDILVKRILCSPTYISEICNRLAELEDYIEEHMGENQFPYLHHRKATDGSYEYWQIVYESYGVMCVKSLL